jgi:hypothetical protein
MYTSNGTVGYTLKTVFVKSLFATEFDHGILSHSKEFCWTPNKVITSIWKQQTRVRVAIIIIMTESCDLKITRVLLYTNLGKRLTVMYMVT